MVEFAQWLQATPFSIWLQSTGWVVPTLQSIHIVMIGLVFVSILMIALRVLGYVRTDEAFGAVLHRFAPWLWGGLVVMLATGLILVATEPVREFTSTSFWLKMALIVIGVVSALAFRRALGPAKLAAGYDVEFSGKTKAAAVGTVVLWLFIIFLGRAIAYDFEIWGPLSLASGG